MVPAVNGSRRREYRRTQLSCTVSDEDALRHFHRRPAGRAAATLNKQISNRNEYGQD
jgi:hypothetical protein